MVWQTSSLEPLQQYKVGKYKKLWCNSLSFKNIYLSPCRPPLLRLTSTRRGCVPGRGVILKSRKGEKVTNTHTYMHRFAVPECVCKGLTCSAWPSPVNLKHWLVSSGLVLGDDSSSPLLTTEWRSYRYTDITVNINKQKQSRTDVHLR